MLSSNESKGKVANVRIEPLHSRHFKEVVTITSEFLNSKHCLCCFPLGMDEDVGTYQKFERRYPEKFAVAAVAVREDDNTVVGFAQMLFENQPSPFHKCKANEAYLEEICVSSDARGMGVGSKLLKWCDDLAIERNCDFIGLDVLYNNPAVGLYQRKGYVIQPKTNCVDTCCGIGFVAIFFGFLICPAGSPSYFNWGRAHYMKKDLK